MSERATEVTALGLLREAIAALTRGDAGRLERLREEAGRAVVLPGEQDAVRQQSRALDLLLGLTRRNLRLLRGDPAGSYGRDVR